VRALLLVAVLMICFSLIGDLKTVALVSNLFIFSTFILVNACVIALRINQPDVARPFRIPGSVRGVPVVSVLAIMMLLTLLGFCIRALVVGEH
jgi:amino acid transporter